VQSTGRGSILVRSEKGVLFNVDLLHCSSCPDPILVGDVVEIGYNGFVSRDMPSKISADWILSARVSGVITEVTDNGFLLTDESGVTYNVHAETALAVGSLVTVWFDGTTEQNELTAWRVRGPELTGIISGVDENAFLLQTGSGELLIRYDGDTLMDRQPEIDARVRVTVTSLADAGEPLDATEIIPEF